MNARSWLHSGVLLSLLVGLSGATSFPSSDDLSVLYKQGMAAFEAGNLENAARTWAQVFQEQPSYVEAKGSVAYWLGYVHRLTGQHEQAHAIWDLGLDALGQEGMFDVQLANIFVRTVFMDVNANAYIRASDVYLAMLAQLDTDLNGLPLGIIGRHVAQTFSVLTEEEQALVADLDASTSNTLRLRTGEDAGAFLVRWWRSQDPLPATLHNERMLEHLSRVIYAEAEYATEESWSGLDDRGMLYVRLGDPSHKIPINFRKAADKIYSFSSVGVSSHDLRPVEFWIYRHIDPDVYYIFVDRNGFFQESESYHIMPKPLRAGFAETRRGQDRAEIALAVMRDVFEQMAVFHPDFGSRYDDVSRYMGLLDDFEADAQGRVRALEVESAGVTSVMQEALQQDNGTFTTRARPTEFVYRMVERGRTRDQQAFSKRDDLAPPAFVEATRDREDLDVAMRTARFLDADGTTRTRIYWAPMAEALAPTKNQRKIFKAQGYNDLTSFILDVTVVQQNTEFLPRAVNQSPRLLRDIAIDGDALIPIQTTEVTGDNAPYHLAIQWDQYLVDLDEQGRPKRGLIVKTGHLSADHLQPLSSHQGTLEMSDLEPRFLDPDSDIEYDDEGQPIAKPYPFDAITSDIPLALYFEVYHLNFGADDLTNYSVEYEISRTGDSGGFLGIGGRPEAMRTSAKTHYTSDSRTAKDFIFLDLSEWRDTGDVEITLRITDEVSKQQIERSIAFELIEG